MLDIIPQIIDRISKAGSFLVVLPFNPNGDHVGSALALKAFLNKLDKEVVVLSPSVVNEKFGFLNGTNSIRNQLNITKSFVIDVSTKRVEVEELSYKKDADKLSIYIKPKKNQFEPSDVTFRSSDFPFEMVICIGVSSLDQLGDFYSHNTEIFFETPILNIDHKSVNENYGQFNLVNLNASSVSEIVFDFINKYEGSLIDEQMATQLLTGIITETNSFQHVRTTPSAFLKASQLVSLGGNQQEIISQLYKNKSIGMLKLWGRVLARLKHEQEIGLAHSLVNRSDIEKSGASEEDINSVIKEMVSQLGFAKTFVFLYEKTESQTAAFVSSLIPVNLGKILSSLNPKIQGQIAVIEIAKPLPEASEALLQILKQELAKNTP